MNRSNFAHSSGVIIDVCKHHGVWFDSEELPKIIDFIRRGGMELARERERTELDAERDQLREERHQMIRDGQRSAVGGLWDTDERMGIGQFIRKLFD